jgi:hypothetical protein
MNKIVKRLKKQANYIDIKHQFTGDDIQFSIKNTDGVSEQVIQQTIQEYIIQMMMNNPKFLDQFMRYLIIKNPNNVVNLIRNQIYNYTIE